MSEYTYQTIKSAGESLYKEKGSKFIGIAMHVENVAEVKAKLEEIKQTYFDARHHCYAYVLNPDADEYRANDDGEPNHSAGDPILGQIRSANLTNTLVVVVRYFGGTKLGVSGLIQAYKTAAEETLKQAVKITEYIAEKLTIEYGYADTSLVMQLVDQMEAKVLDQQFDATCRIKLALRPDKLASFKNKLKILNEQGIEISVL